MAETITIVIKTLAAVFFLIALYYSVRNYRLTKTVSNIWLYMSLAMASAFTLSFVRTIKELWFMPELEIIKIELIPLTMAFLLTAAITVRKERGLPRIIPIPEPSEITYCGTPYSRVCIEDMEKQKAAAKAGKKKKCPVRICVEEKGLRSCRECSEYPDCEIRTTAIDKCKLFKYKLEKGHVYLKKEDDSEGSFELFVDLLMCGLQGLCITRTNPEMIRKRYKIKKTPIAWLTEMQTTDELTISPQLERLLHVITDFIDKGGKSVILLDGLGYLIQHNNFRRVLHFLHRLGDKIAVSNSRLIITINPSTIGDRELKLLELEADIIEI